MSRSHRPQDPRDYLGEFNDLSETVLNSFSGAPAAAPRPNGGSPADLSHLMLVQRQYEQKVGGILREMERDLDQRERDNTAMSAELERINKLIEGQETAMTTLKSEIATLTTSHATALSEAKAAATTEKVALEGQVAAKTTEVDTLTGQLAEVEGKVTSLTAKVDELTTANATLTTANEELEARVVKLGGAKKGLLAAPPAEKTSTVKGDEIAPTKALTLKEAETEGKAGGEGGPDPEDGEMGVLLQVYTDYCNLSDVKNKAAGRASQGWEVRERLAFLNDPRPGCEACKADPQHHHNLVVNAINRRKEILQFAATV